MSSSLHRIALFAERHYRGIFIGTAILVVISILLATRLRFDPDVLSLLPKDDPVVNSFQEVLKEFGGLDLLLIAVRIPEGAVIDPYQEFVDELGPALEALPEIEYVDYRIGEPEALLRQFFPRALLFLDAQGRAAVEARLTDEGIRQQIGEMRRLLTTPQALARKELMTLDPFGLAEVFLDRLAGGSGGLGVDLSTGHYLSQDRRLLLLLAKPIRPAQDIAFSEHLDEVVNATIDGLRADRERPQGAGAGLWPDVALGGGYLIALDDASLIKQDIVVNAVSSMAVVLLLFLFAFRRLGLLFYAFVPLTCGLILAFGFAGATVGVLSSATSGFAALLIGLGIDFVIVSYGRFVEERQRGADPSEALRQMTGSCGRAVVVGGVTSAATFYAFGITEFTGLRQMGILTATGILFCMVAVLLLLPAMLAWSENRHRNRATSPKLYLHGFGADAIVRFALRWPRAVLVTGALLTVGAACLLPGLYFEDAIQNMRPEGNRGVKVQQEVAEHFGTSFQYMMLVLEGEEAGEVIALADRAVDEAQPMLAEGVLNRVDSIATLIPPPAQQQAVLSWLETGRESGALDPVRMRATVEEAFVAQGLRAAPFEEGLQLLTDALSVSEPITLDTFDNAGGAGRLLERYLRHDGEEWTSVVYLYPPPERFKRAPPVEAEALAASLGPQAVLTGVNVVSRNLRKQVWVDAVLAAVLGTVVVALLLWLDFRSLRAALLALVPLFIGIVWMLGAMVLFGIDMNFMNIFVTTMIIGIGVDYGIHMLHRIRELEGADLATLTAGLSETGKAIVMAAASTIVGFGSLVLSHYPALRSIGFVAILGALLTALVAITLLPAFLALRLRRMSSK